jgi:hypothetical protein
MKKIFLLLLLAVGVSVGRAQAQQGEVVVGLRSGDNATLGTFTALSVEAEYSSSEYFSMRGGVLYNTIKRGVVELRPEFFLDLNYSRISAQFLFNYTHQNRVNNYAIGGGAMFDGHRVWATLGYYYRVMTLAGDAVQEPFNIFYELGFRCFPGRERWDLNIIFSNSRFFELERHYQPSLSAEAWWFPLKRLGVQVSANYKSAGMFNISSDYYQLYANVGICYRW